MAGLIRIGDQLGCGDVVATGSGNVFINGLSAARIGVDLTAGHCHGPTLLYRDAVRVDSRIRINGLEAVVQGDWNVPANKQPTNTCGVSCGNSCHDSQIIAGSPDVGK